MSKMLTSKPLSDEELAQRLEALTKEALNRIDPDITGEFRVDAMHQVGLLKGCLLVQGKRPKKEVK